MSITLGQLADENTKDEQDLLDEQPLPETSEAEAVAYDRLTGEKIKIIPTPNFTGISQLGTYLPINMLNETVSNMSRYAQELIEQGSDLISFIQKELGYSSRLAVQRAFKAEQIDALIFAIRQFEKNQGFILGDMAGIGKGRVCSGVLRYAYQKGLTPIFVTHKPYLYNDIYRDIKNIGGFGLDAKGNVIMPKPFIMNRNEKNTDAIIKVKDSNGADAIIARPLKDDDTIEICKRKKLPKEYNCVFLTYSIISASKLPFKREFLYALAPKSIFVLDESHNAASGEGDSKISTHMEPIIKLANAILFSSATYAKNTNVFQLYIPKTALSTAVPDLQIISNALKVGGENVQEYIASGLVKEGQMLRRERSFGDCTIDTSIVKDIPAGTGGEPFLQDEIYDAAVGFFRRIKEFCGTDKYYKAVLSAIERAAGEANIEVADIAKFNTLYRAKAKTTDDYTRAVDEFLRTNRGKYVFIASGNPFSRYQFVFMETLYLALKAKWSAKEILKTLTDETHSYTNFDGTEHFAPMKPILSIRLTQDSLLTLLGLNIGDTTKNDLSVYLQALYNAVFNDEVTLTKVDNTLFMTKAELEERGLQKTEQEISYTVLPSDFSDDGVEAAQLRDALNNYHAQIPMSVIDYLRNEIENAERPSFYKRFQKDPSKKFQFAELTKRSRRLKYVSDDMWIVAPNDNPRSASDGFTGFNNGVYDVLLINVAASTGGSAQSSPDEGKDTRPRNMFILQFELDIAVEVQKRGRVNRTGQLNNPTYTYLITNIASELRRYLMFRRKLRKLDANVSANQTQSGDSVAITDREGNPIENIFNFYGYQTFIENILGADGNDELQEIERIFNQWRELPSFFGGGRNTSVADANSVAEEKQITEEQFANFARYLEIFPARVQRSFYDYMNIFYTQKKAALIARDEFEDEELNTKNYKASLKRRIVVQLNSGTTTFSSPLFIEENFTFEDKVALDRAAVEERTNELCEGKTPEEFTRWLKSDIQAQYNAEIARRLEALRAEYTTDRNDFETDEEYVEQLELIDLRLSRERTKLLDKRNTILGYIEAFPIGSIAIYQNAGGKVVGYKISGGGNFRYSAGKVHIVFCFLNRFPIIDAKISSDFEMLNSIQRETAFAATYQDYEAMKGLILAWQPNRETRIVRRFLSGNILSGIVDAEKRRSSGEISKYKLVRFTNIDNSVKTAIELTYNAGQALSDLQDDNTPLSISLKVDNIMEYIDAMPIQQNYYGRSAEYLELRNYAFSQNNWVVFTKKERGTSYPERANGAPAWVTQYIFYIMAPATQKLPDNPVYDDNEFYEKWKDYNIDGENIGNGIRRPSQKTTIKFFPKKVTVPQRGGSITRYAASQRTLMLYKIQFEDLTPRNREKLVEFVKELGEKFNITLSFLASTEAYLNISEQDDVPNVKSSGTGSSIFPKGEYKYYFIQSFEKPKTIIPNYIRDDVYGRFGGVVVSQPLPPKLLPSYGLVPNEVPSDILAKLFFAEIPSAEKLETEKHIKKLIEDGASNVSIGMYLEGYISKISAPIKYFFGEVRLGDIGLAMKTFIESGQSVETKIVQKASVAAKTNIASYEDAENYLLLLL